MNLKEALALTNELAKRGADVRLVVDNPPQQLPDWEHKLIKNNRETIFPPFRVRAQIYFVYSPYTEYGWSWQLPPTATLFDAVYEGTKALEQATKWDDPRWEDGCNGSKLRILRVVDSAGRQVFYTGAHDWSRAVTKSALKRAAKRLGMVIQ